MPRRPCKAERGGVSDNVEPRQSHDEIHAREELAKAGHPETPHPHRAIDFRAGLVSRLPALLQSRWSCRSNLRKMSRLLGPSPIPAYATSITGAFFFCGSRKKGNGLRAPTAQKKSDCAPCISSGKLKWSTVARSSCIRPCASNT